MACRSKVCAIFGCMLVFFSNSMSSAEITERFLKIENYNGEILLQSIEIPISAIEFMSSVLPNHLQSEFDYRGFDIESVIRAVRRDNFKGILMIIDNANSKQKTVISIE
jgi:hypothetical protein